MAKIRSTASFLHTGRIGNTTYYVSGGTQVARVAQNSSNYGEYARRTTSQQSNRAKWANLVNFYKVSKGWMREAFESKLPRQSDYNKFMSVNLNSANIYLTRDMYAQGGCVVSSFKISEGSLRTIGINQAGNQWATDLSLGTLTIGASTTVGEFSAALEDNNLGVKDGMQLSFISYQQDILSDSVPHLICTPYEVTLNRNSGATLRDYLPDFCSATINGFLATSARISIGAFAYVWSDSTSGRTLVSSQRLISNNEALVDQYTSELAKAAAIASYGVEEDVFLMSGSEPTRATAQPLYMSAMEVNGTYIPVGSTYFVGSDLPFYPGHLSSVSFEYSVPLENVTRVAIYGSFSTLTLATADYNVEGKSIILTSSGLTKVNALTSGFKTIRSVIAGEQIDGVFTPDEELIA